MNVHPLCFTRRSFPAPVPDSALPRPSMGSPTARYLAHPWARRHAVFLLLFLACGGAYSAETLAPPQAEFEGTHDPLEGMNRVIYRFNNRVDRALLKPVAKAYDALLPDPVQHSVSRFFSNLLAPTVILNDVLQGKMRQSASDTGRFVVNTTVGIAGLFDVATKIGLPPHDEDFGQTLGVWGMGTGPYVVWPILGPKNLRDSIGWLGDYATQPITYVDDAGDQWGLWALNLIDTRANLLGVSNVLEQAAGQDEYLFVREAYGQRRANLIYDGNPPKPQFFDDDLSIEPPTTQP